MANRLLCLARHGEAEPAQAANPENGELTATGRQQSELLGKRLQGIPFAAIHHSPWTRSARTAAIVAEHLPGIPLLSSDLLQECIPAVPDRQQLTPSQAEFFDHLPKQRVAAGPAQAAATVQAYTGPVAGRMSVAAASAALAASSANPAARPGLGAALGRRLGLLTRPQRESASLPNWAAAS